jgi:osmoprotectant transport system ATP-binding protein
MVSHDIDEAIKLGDQVAIFRAGKLVQFDHPDTLLARPKDDFVSAFVGQDHTLKRLLLVRAGDAATTPATARPGLPLQDAMTLMDDQDARYLTITDNDNRALGYVSRRDIRSAGTVGVSGDKVKPFNLNATPDENLRVVLSKMYKHSASWMPVIDAEGKYLGEVTQDSIADYLSSGKSRGQKMAA